MGFFTSMLGSKELDVPLIYQYPDFPTGCESVSTVEMLQYNGYSITPDEFIDNYLDTISYDDSLKVETENIFDCYFLGNPRSSHGFLCNPPVIHSAVSEYFSEINEVSKSPIDLTGTSFEFLLDEIAVGNPVVIWLTNTYAEPRERKINGSRYFTPSHTVCLSGYDLDKGIVYISDPISGYVELDIKRAKYLYDTVGRKSFTVR